MSGGVDSSLAASLLLKQGFDVEGITMKLSPGVCCDIGSAQEVCAHLGISHGVIDMQKEFARSIVHDFVAEYRSGRTPNPCIRCNELIKFRTLMQYARTHDFDYLATGHYVRIAHDENTGRSLLKKGVDEEKDQSYFLYRMTQEQLEHVLFPLGDYKKEEVRRLAKEQRIPAAERAESQEICFVPGTDYRSFLKENAPDSVRPGEMVMMDGRVVGKHDGIAFFTIGQRRKLGVAAGSRLYVVRIDPGSNRVFLGEKQDLMTREAHATDTRYCAFDTLRSSLDVTVKVRYRSPYVPATIEPAGRKRTRIAFKEPVPGVCPGQAAVFYQDDTVVGGGIIETS